MTAITQFWGTFIGAGLAAIVLFGWPLSRGRVRMPGVSPRDFRQFTGRNGAFADPCLVAAARQAFGGWRVAWLVVVFALLSAAAQAAWDAALPPEFHVHSASTAALRAVPCMAASFWLTGRLVVASIHRHAHDARVPAVVA